MYIIYITKIFFLFFYYIYTIYSPFIYSIRNGYVNNMYTYYIPIVYNILYIVKQIKTYNTHYIKIVKPSSLYIFWGCGVIFKNIYRVGGR